MSYAVVKVRAYGACPRPRTLTLRLSKEQHSIPLLQKRVLSPSSFCKLASDPVR